MTRHDKKSVPFCCSCQVVSIALLRTQLMGSCIERSLLHYSFGRAHTWPLHKHCRNAVDRLFYSQSDKVLCDLRAPCNAVAVGRNARGLCHTILQEWLGVEQVVKAAETVTRYVMFRKVSDPLMLERFLGHVQGKGGLGSLAPFSPVQPHLVFSVVSTCEHL